MSGHHAHRIMNDIIKIFADMELKTLQTNLKVANFLDATLCLATGRHYTYWKPNDRPLYIHCQSNYPQTSCRTYQPLSADASQTSQVTKQHSQKPALHTMMRFMKAGTVRRRNTKNWRESENEETDHATSRNSPTLQQKCSHQHRSKISPFSH